MCEQLRGNVDSGWSEIVRQGKDQALRSICTLPGVETDVLSHVTSVRGGTASFFLDTA